VKRPKFVIQKEDDLLKKAQYELVQRDNESEYVGHTAFDKQEMQDDVVRWDSTTMTFSRMSNSGSKCAYFGIYGSVEKGQKANDDA
jgi:hypothetical protein